MIKEVMILTGVGQIGMAIVRCMGYGMKIVVSDRSIETSADFLIDGGATASYFYGPLNPNAK